MIELIPAIDIIDGHCVRLRQGDYSQKTEYSSEPAEVAKAFEGAGVRRLHVVDLDGAKAKHIVNAKVVEQIASSTSLVVDFGGGIKSSEDLQTAFDAGAAMVTVGSVAVSNPDLFMGWVSQYGESRFILGADTRNGKISINGWLEDDAQQSVIPFIKKYHASGISQVLCTDISLDGMMQGPSIELYRNIMKEVPDLHLIASGGVSCMDDIRALDAAGIPAVVFGKAFYEGKITLKDLEQYVS